MPMAAPISSACMREYRRASRPPITRPAGRWPLRNWRPSSSRTSTRAHLQKSPQADSAFGGEAGSRMNLLAPRKHGDEFFDPGGAGFRSLGRLDAPEDGVPIRAVQCAEELQRQRVRVQRALEIVGNL